MSGSRSRPCGSGPRSASTAAWSAAVPPVTRIPAKPWRSRSMGGSGDAGAAHDGPRREHQEPQLAKQRGTPEESHVEPAAVVEAHRIPAPYLPRAGDARPVVEPLRVPEVIGLGAEARRPGAYQGHIAAHHV